MVAEVGELIVMGVSGSRWWVAVVPGLTPPHLPRKKKLVYNGLKWPKMDFKGIFSYFYK